MFWIWWSLAGPTTHSIDRPPASSLQFVQRPNLLTCLTLLFSLPVSWLPFQLLFMLKKVRFRNSYSVYLRIFRRPTKWAPTSILAQSIRRTVYSFVFQRVWICRKWTNWTATCQKHHSIDGRLRKGKTKKLLNTNFCSGLVWKRRRRSYNSLSAHFCRIS
jgi:hypothetical protein